MTTCPHCGGEFKLQRNRPGTFIAKFRALTYKQISYNQLYGLFPDMTPQQIWETTHRMTVEKSWRKICGGLYAIRKPIKQEARKISLDNKTKVCHTNSHDEKGTQ